MDNKEQILKFLRHKIRHIRTDTLWNHLKTVFGIDYDYSGIVKNNDFVIWNYEVWGGAFYPVIYGTVIETNGNTVIRITAKMNSFAFILSAIIVVGFFLGMFLENLNGNPIGKFMLSAIFASLPLIAINMGYRYQRKKIIESFSELIKEEAADSQIEIL